MLIMDSRPQLEVKNINVDNLSADKKVFFIEEGHKYYHIDDIKDGEISPFEVSTYQFSSPTGILGEFKEKFETEKQAKAYVAKHGLDITWEELAAQWKAKGDAASEEGTLLHGYAESVWNDWGMEKPDNVKADYVHTMHDELKNFAELARTELLIYSTVLGIAGQVDLLLRSKDRSKYYILDYKFIKEPIKKKSFYNFRTKKYKMMKGPFRKLQDSNYFHYSIQMEMYRYLMGSLGKKVKGKYLLIFTPEKYEMVEGYSIKIWVDTSGTLHAMYKDYRGKMFDSSKDKTYLKKPYKIKNFKL